MTINVGIYEARTDFSRLIALVESGEEDVMVTRHGKPVAHIVAPQPHLQTPQEMLDDDARKEQRWLRWQAMRSTRCDA
jgi:prevent-host-death family protein